MAMLNNQMAYYRNQRELINPLSFPYQALHVYFSKARDFWEAQLSGDAPQRVARGPIGDYLI